MFESENNENLNNNEISLDDFLESNEHSKDKITIQKVERKTVHIEALENNSGQGELAPESVRKHFNWGAFLLNWIFGLRYKKWFLLLIPIFCIIPFGYIVSIILSIFAGIKGNQWAWEEVSYKNEEDFHQAQKGWVKLWAVLMAIITLFSIIIGGALFPKPVKNDNTTDIKAIKHTVPFISSELKIPNEVFKKTDITDSHAEFLTSDKYYIYWIRTDSELVQTNKDFVSKEYQNSKEQLGDKFVLSPDIRKGEDNQNIEISCKNDYCIDSWLFQNCHKGYCIINPQAKTFYKVKNKENLISKAMLAKQKWQKK